MSTMASSRRKFTLEDKRRLLALYDELPDMSLRNAAFQLNITVSMLWTMLHNRSLIAQGQSAPAGPRKPRVVTRIRGGKLPRLEATLWKWIDNARKNGGSVTDLMIHRRAIDLAARMCIINFRPSPAWYRSFKKREEFVRRRYGVYPENTEQQTDQPEPELPSSDTGSGSGGTPPPSTSSLYLNPEPEGENSNTYARTETGSEEGEQFPLKREPTVLTAVVDGDVRSVTVPSLHQMKEAMQTLATGLLYRGFCDFKLLHQFETEVTKVIKRSMAQGSQDSFVA